jgi:hypothetical protein
VKRHLALLCVTVVAGFAGFGLSPGSGLLPTESVAYAKPCGAGWVHASLSWGHKCLRRGQFCKSYKDREYHRYGFHCHTGRLR